MKLPLNSVSTPTKIRKRRVLNLGINVIKAKSNMIEVIPQETIAMIMTDCNHPTKIISKCKI